MKIDTEKLKEVINSNEVLEIIRTELVHGNSVELKIEKNKLIVVHIPRKAIIKIGLD